MTSRMLSHSLLTVILAGLVLAGRAVADDLKGGADLFKRLKDRSIGPAVGGRVCRVCGVPGPLSLPCGDPPATLVPYGEKDGQVAGLLPK